MKKFLSFVLIFTVLSCSLPTFVFASSSESSLPAWNDVSAKSFILMDGDTGDVLSEENADLPLPMASTTKIMTCLIALEEGSMNDEVVIPREAVGIEGSSVYLTFGEKLTLSDLLFALMLESANDAAVAIALHVSSSVENFVAKMNEKAANIGMTNTRFQNPNGLPADGHQSTARDMALLMKVAMENLAFREIAGTKTKSISAPEGKSRFLSNHNRLLRSYEPCIAGKTGYTKNAGRCLVTAAEKEEKTLICVTLSAPNDWKDHEYLFEYGFSLYSKRDLLSPQTLQISVPLVGGTAEALNVVNYEGLSLHLRSGETVTNEVYLPSFVYAPVREGDQIGSVVYHVGTNKVYEIPLVADSSVNAREIKLNFWQRIWKQFCEWLD